MNIKSLLFILLCSYSFSQENILNLNKAEESKFVLDGILSEQELENSVELEILYEHEPGYNITPEYKTTGYLIYTDTFYMLALRLIEMRLLHQFIQEIIDLYLKMTLQIFILTHMVMQEIILV